jgi:hypothetical protein
MLNVIMLNVIMLNVIMLNVIMLNVVVLFFGLSVAKVTMKCNFLMAQIS